MKKVRVLVVDDNRRIVNLLKNALEKEEEVEVVGTDLRGRTSCLASSGPGYHHGR